MAEPTPPPRLPTAVLAGLVVAALGLGGLWWTATDPSGDGAAPFAAADPTATGTEPARPSETLGEAEDRLRVLRGLDATPRVTLDDEWQAESEPFSLSRSEPLSDREIAELLPPRDNPVLRHGAVVPPQTTVATATVASAGDFRLEVACEPIGAQVSVSLEGPSMAVAPFIVTCDGSFPSREITLDQAGQATVSVSAPGDEPVTVAYQLLRD